VVGTGAVKSWDTVEVWDVVVVGGGPAGLAAAAAAARAGARVLVLEKAAHPRYKTCGGGLIATSLASLPASMSVPVRAVVRRATFTCRGRLPFTRTAAGAALVSMVERDEFDAALCAQARAAGAVVREQALVRGLSQDPDAVTVRLADGSVVTGRVVVGADGSAGVTAAHVGVRYDQVDLGLEVELPVASMGSWHDRLLIDWGPIPGSYGWVFPKYGQLTVGVIAARGRADATRAYLRSFVERLGLSGVVAVQESGHLTRCRAGDSPLRHGRVLVAGDAAGLLEPWTREGISFALRSGALAGAAAASGDLDSYPAAVAASLAPTMAAGARLLAVFGAHPLLLHAVLATPPGWRWFAGFCRGQSHLEDVVNRLPVRAALAVLS
jgi:geranylgeranyl reductase family protein